MTFSKMADHGDWNLELKHIISISNSEDFHFLFFYYYFIMWDYVHTEGMRQRGTLKTFEQISSSPILCMEWLCLYIYRHLYLSPLIYTDIHTYTVKHTYEHIHTHIHTHLNLSTHRYTHILKYTCTYLLTNHTNNILSKAIFSSDWVIQQINWFKFFLDIFTNKLDIGVNVLQIYLHDKGHIIKLVLSMCNIIYWYHCRKWVFSL